MNTRIKKIIPYLLMLIILIRIFTFAPMQAEAQTNPPATNTNNETAGSLSSSVQAGAPTTGENGNKTSDGTTPYQQYLDANVCVFSSPSGTLWPGCALQVANGLFVVIPAYFLRVTGYFFNFLVEVTLSSSLFSSSSFLPTAWGVVRDISNIFFILILLYISIQIILDIGHDAKKAIARVLIIALLINFSMFFTEVIIDSSNILALIFYNKISVNTTQATDASGKPITRQYTPIGNENDVSGGLVGAFNPTALMSKDFLAPNTGATGTLGWWGKTKLNTQDLFYQVVDGDHPGQLLKDQSAAEAAAYTEVNREARQQTPSTVIAIMILSGVIMFFGCYAFFVAGFSFLARLIELFILIVFSPFAFMSFSIHELAHIEYIGWDSWFKRLLKVAFMAPIFMFFMYFIFLLIGSNMFNVPNSQNGMVVILGMVIPALFVLILLLKATHFAKEGSGALGELVMKGANMVGGLALGAATGGTAMAGRAIIGRAGAAAANSEWAKNAEIEGKFGAKFMNKGLSALGSSSFDARAVKIGGKSLASTGMNVGAASTGGFTERKAKYVKNRQERAKQLEVGEDEELKQNLNKVEEEKQALLRNVSHELEELDKRLKGARERSNDLATQARATENTDDPTKVAARKIAIQTAAALPDTDKTKATRLESAKLMDVSDPTKVAARQLADNAARKQASVVEELVEHKKAIKNGSEDFIITDLTATASQPAGKIYFTNNRSVNGRSLNQLEDEIIPEAHHHLEEENRRRNFTYANTIQSRQERWIDYVLSGGSFNSNMAKEAAYNIRTRAKIESGKDGGGHGGGTPHATPGGNGGHSTPPPAHGPAPAHH